MHIFIEDSLIVSSNVGNKNSKENADNTFIVECIDVAAKGSANADANPMDKQFFIQLLSSLPLSNLTTLMGSTLLPKVVSISLCASSTVIKSSEKT